MIVDPKQKLKNIYFYNNLILITCIFCVICFITAIVLENKTQSSKNYYYMQDGQLFGPLKVKSSPLIYELKSYFYGDNQSIYLSGEVLDEDKDTLYEFGKDLWHESGYDSEGYWSESDRQLSVKLSFTEPGTYYIKLDTDEKMLPTLKLTLLCKKGSGIPHFMIGCYILLFLSIAFIFINAKWVKEKIIRINEILEEMADD